jgi:Mn2+/Fe2+ NRAMP family transporter
VAGHAVERLDEPERLVDSIKKPLTNRPSGFATIKLDPSWADVGRGFVPEARIGAIYWYFVVGLIAAALMPYEMYFYSSGAVEERWDERDMAVNRANSIIGFGIGGLLSVGILVASAQVLRPAGITPDSLGATALVAKDAFGETSLLLALLGILFAVGGATIDTAFSAAYNLAQHQGLRSGKRFKLLEEPRFTLSLAGFLLLGFAIVQTGVDPVELTEYAVIFSIPVLPLTYLPILLVGNDRAAMGKPHRTQRSPAHSRHARLTTNRSSCRAPRGRDAPTRVFAAACRVAGAGCPPRLPQNRACAVRTRVLGTAGCEPRRRPLSSASGHSHSSSS